MHLHHNPIIDSKTQSWLWTCKSCWPVICLGLPDYYLINSTPHTHVHRPIDFLLHTPLPEEDISWFNECLTSLTGFFLYLCFWKNAYFMHFFPYEKCFLAAHLSKDSGTSIDCTTCVLCQKGVAFRRKLYKRECIHCCIYCHQFVKFKKWITVDFHQKPSVIGRHWFTAVYLK